MLHRKIPARLAIAATFVVATSAAITPAVALGSDPATGVTVILKGPDNAGLQQLANTHGLSHAQRMRALSRLLPTDAEHDQAVKALEAEGLTIASQSAWSVSATAPRSTVSRTFGVHAAAQAHATSAEQAAATGPYPQLPASLQGVATAAFPTTGGPAAFHSHDVTCSNCLGGSDFRNAYATPQTAVATGYDSAAALTIATIQPAAWNPGDLTNWANTPGNVVGPTFNPSTSITLVPVDQASVPTPTAQDQGDEEVDLDQEVLLGTDPYAHQRPYFTPNTDAGIADAYSQIVDDVLQDANAYQGGDSHIVAVSSSWGVCEADTGTAAIKALEPILTSVVAAGVTIFSASGDEGIYDDCTSAPPGVTPGAGVAITGVDYPASSPEAVAVGGTSLSPIGASNPNNGSNWAESAWTCATDDACTNPTTGSGGSGGGVSSVFAKPTYQNKIANAPFAAVTSRMVPDISADGDPATGFRIYTTDPKDTQNTSAYMQLGGTSLAAPESAALFTNALAAHGATSGIGDIHQGLYNAYAANTGAFRDITTGTNGAAADAGADPSVNAGTGYDTVSGLGAPLWSSVVPYLLAAKPPLPPKATAALNLANPASATQATHVTASWAGVESSSALAIQSASVTIQRKGQAAAVYSNPNAAASGSYTFTGVAGATYQLVVTSQDIAGDRSKQVFSTLAVPIDDKAFRYNGQWRRRSSSGDYAGSAEFTNRRSSYALVTATGRTYALIVKTGPNFGQLRITWNGFQLKTLNLYSPSPGSRQVVFFDSGTRRSRTFQLMALGTAVIPSYGANVGLDGLIVGY